MRSRRWRGVLWALCWCAAGAVQSGWAETPAVAEPAPATPLTLDDAIDRVVTTHPDLRIFRYTDTSLRAAADIAAQRPALTLGASVENALGTGDASGIHGAEFTFSLASVLERGGKRAARQALAASRIDALAMTREAKRLDLLAEVARRYLDLVATQAQVAINDADVAQRGRTVAAAAQRVRAGASPESVRLAAEAVQARAELDRDRARTAVVAARRRLVLLWGEQEDVAVTAVGDPLVLPTLPAFASIAAQLDHTPELQRFADEDRVREARVQLASSARTPDLDWQIGVRRLQERGDWGLVGSVSIPLGSAGRAEPDIRAAIAEREALTVERESSALVLHATLAQAYDQFIAAKLTVERTRDDLLPRLAHADAASERAYRGGALSALEWAQVQTETTAARQQQLAAAIEAQRALIEIQRLTAEPLTSDSLDKEATP